MAEFEEKFIVINRKHIEELMRVRLEQDVVLSSAWQVLDAIAHFWTEYYGEFGGRPHRYYVVNQDEPYADKVLKMILEGEEEKEK